MINANSNVQSPKTGLLEMLSGGQALDPAQTAISADDVAKGGEADIGEFMQALAQAQDRKIEPDSTEPARSKGEMQALKIEEDAKKSVKVAEKQDPKDETEVKKAEEKKKSDVNDGLGAGAGSMVSQFMRPIQVGQQAQPKLDQETEQRGDVKITAKALSEGDKIPSQKQKAQTAMETMKVVPSQQMSPAALTNIGLSRENLLSEAPGNIPERLTQEKSQILSSTKKGHESQQAPALGGVKSDFNALQPILMQSPVMVDLVNSQRDVPAAPVVRGEGSGNMRFSQDFILEHGAGLDPSSMALIWGRHRASSDDATDQRDGSSDAEDKQGSNLTLSQIMGRQSGAELHLVKNAETSKFHELGAPALQTMTNGSQASGRVDVTNAAALAAQVQRLSLSGGGSVKLRVAPENLGELTILVQTKGSKLDVKFEAASAEAREALANTVPELRQALAAGRYQVGEIQVGSSLPNDAMGVAQLSNGSSSQFSSSDFGQGGLGRQHEQRQQSEGNPWDRYFAQQDERGFANNGRQRSAYRRYQEAGMTG